MAQAHGRAWGRGPTRGGAAASIQSNLWPCPSPSPRRALVTGPLGAPVEAEWLLLSDGTAGVESARASGLALVGGANDPLVATSRGTGELLAAAVRGGARRIIV